MVFSLCVCSLVMNRSLLHTPSPCLVDSFSTPLHSSPHRSRSQPRRRSSWQHSVFSSVLVFVCVSVLVLLCVFVCVRVSVLVCVGTLFPPSHTFLHVSSHPPYPHRRSRHPVQHLVHCMHDTHLKHKSSHFSSPTTRHADYRGFSLGHVMLVFPRFQSFTPQESAEVLGAKNFAPRVCSCLPFCSPISAPFQAADFALEPMRHRQLDQGGGGCHHRAGPLFCSCLDDVLCSNFFARTPAISY